MSKRFKIFAVCSFVFLAFYGTFCTTTILPLSTFTGLNLRYHFTKFYYLTVVEDSSYVLKINKVEDGIVWFEDSNGKFTKDNLGEKLIENFENYNKDELGELIFESSNGQFSMSTSSISYVSLFGLRIWGTADFNR